MIRDISSEELRTQDQYNNDPGTQHDPFNGIICLYISNFFTDAINLVYYIRGTRNVAMFCSGMSGMQAFNGAALFAATHLTLEGITQLIWGRLDVGDTRTPKRLVKSKSPIEVNKWRYIFETGRMVWEKSGIDLGKLNEAMEISESGGTHKGKRPASEDAANKMACLRGGSGRPDSHLDGLLQKVINNPKYERFLTLREWASRNKSTNKSRHDTTDDLHGMCSNRDTPNQSPSKHDTVDNFLHADDEWVGAAWSGEVSSNQDTIDDAHGTSPDHAAPDPPPSLPDPVDNLDEQCFEQRAKQWSIPSSVVRYGMSDEWQANIKQASRPASHELHRQRYINDVRNAVRRGDMRRSQAQWLLRRTKGLKLESTRKFTLAPQDIQAAEVLGRVAKRLPGREKDAGTSRASAGNVETNTASARSKPAVSSQRNEAVQQLDSDAWLASILDLDQFSEEGKMPQDQ